MWKSTVSRCFGTYPESEIVTQRRELYSDDEAYGVSKPFRYDESSEYDGYSNSNDESIPFDSDKPDIDESCVTLKRNYVSGAISNVSFIGNVQESCHNNKRDPYVPNNLYHNIPNVDCDMRNLRGSNQRDSRTALYIDKLLREARDLNPQTNTLRQLYFHPRACLGKSSKETLKPLFEAFQGEIQRFHGCLYPNSTGRIHNGQCFYIS